MTSEVDERITLLDDVIFKAETGQLSLSWEEYEARKVEVAALMKVLAETLATLNGRSVEEMYDLRQRLRSADRISKALKLHCELHPEQAAQEDPLLIAMNNAKAGTEEQENAIEAFAAQFEYLFKNAPKPPKRGFLARLLRR